MTQGQRLYAEKPYLRLQVPHSLDEPPTSHVPLATSSPRSCASMSGHRGPTRWHVDRTSLELIFVVSIPDQARGTDRTAYGDVSLMSSPASRSIYRQYTGPILVNIPAHHQVQLRPIIFFADSNISQNTTPSADTKQALSTGCYTIHLFQPWYPYLTMSGCMVGYRLWQTQSTGMVPINTLTHVPPSSLTSQPWRYTLGHRQRRPVIDPTPSHIHQAEGRCLQNNKNAKEDKNGLGGHGTPKLPQINSHTASTPESCFAPTKLYFFKSDGDKFTPLKSRPAHVHVAL